VNSADPIDSVETWRCRGSQNYTGYCDTRVDRLLLRSNLALQADTRASLLNQADALIA